jgi:hypothetical protein
MNYLCNALAIGMLPDGEFEVSAVNTAEVPADAVSCVGHQSTADAFAVALGRSVQMNRTAIALKSGDSAYVGALTGLDGKIARLPEGQVLDAATLAASYRVVWRRVTVK